MSPSSWCMRKSQYARAALSTPSRRDWPSSSPPDGSPGSMLSKPSLKRLRACWPGASTCGNRPIPLPRIPSSRRRERFGDRPSSACRRTRSSSKAIARRASLSRWSSGRHADTPTESWDSPAPNRIRDRAGSTRTTRSHKAGDRAGRNLAISACPSREYACSKALTRSSSSSRLGSSSKCNMLGIHE